MMSMELLPIPSSNRYLLEDCILNCLKNRCICKGDDLVKLSLEILDIELDRISEEEEYHDDYTILHGIANCLYSLIERCCSDKWLSFLRKIVDRFPVEILSMQNGGFTPYDFLIKNSSLCHDKQLMKDVLEIFKPR